MKGKRKAHFLEFINPLEIGHALGVIPENRLAKQE